MPSYKIYTVDQYQAFLKHKFNDNFKKSEEWMADYFMKQNLHIIGHYGLTKANMLSTYIPLLKSLLSGGYFMFLMISIQENPTGGMYTSNWINHFASNTSSSPYQMMKDDCEYILSISNNMNSSVSLSAHEVEGGAQAVEDKPGAATSFLHSLPAFTIGRYYMPATMAGNSWVYCEKWTLAHQGTVAPSAYYGNPYNQIIAVIKAAGVDPFADDGGGSGGGAGGDGEPTNPDQKPTFHFLTIKPGYVYLRGSLPIKNVDGIKFQRFNNFLIVKYDVLNGAGGDNGDDTNATDQNDDEPASDKIDKIMNNLKLLNKKQLTYSNFRPAQNIMTKNFTDCSGFVGWLLHDTYPTIWNNGSINTGTIYVKFKAIKDVIWEGSQASFTTSGMRKKVKKGDILVMGSNDLSGAGNDQHVGIMDGDGDGANFVNQSPDQTYYDKPLSWFLDTWYTTIMFKHWCVIRIK